MKKRRIIWDWRVGSWFNMSTNTYSPGFPGTGMGFTVSPPQVDNNGWDMADVPRFCQMVLQGRSMKYVSESEEISPETLRNHMRLNGYRKVTGRWQ